MEPLGRRRCFEHRAEIADNACVIQTRDARHLRVRARPLVRTRAVNERLAFANTLRNFVILARMWLIGGPFDGKTSGETAFTSKDATWKQRPRDAVCLTRVFRNEVAEEWQELYVGKKGQNAFTMGYQSPKGLWRACPVHCGRKPRVKRRE